MARDPRIQSTKGAALAWMRGRFDADDTDECFWVPWRATYSVGAVFLDGVRMDAHVVICTWAHGPNPEPGVLEVAHSCGSRGCLNRRHVRWATHQENMNDQLGPTGKRQFGSARNGAKLTEDDVREIRRLAGTMTKRALAHRYGVGEMTIGRIIRREKWKHIT
jgi:HNH endonuclease